MKGHIKERFWNGSNMRASARNNSLNVRHHITPVQPGGFFMVRLGATWI